MQFDLISKNKNRYLDSVMSIIREGIKIELPRIKKNENENLKNQSLVDSLNILGTKNPKTWIGVQKEHIGNNQNREDIYFYLHDDNRTRIFYIEGKRLPKYNTKDKEEYVRTQTDNKKISGGIERFRLGLHGEPDRMDHYGMVAYVENSSIDHWLSIINNSLRDSKDNILTPNGNFLNEFISSHNYESPWNGKFKITHFWIDLTK